MAVADGDQHDMARSIEEAGAGFEPWGGLPSNMTGGGEQVVRPAN